MDSIYHIDFENGVHWFFDVNDISHGFAYEYNSEDGGKLCLYMKNGEHQSFDGMYEGWFKKTFTQVFNEIIALKQKIKEEQYD